ncbi:MAG: hypothetical protein ABH883_01285 [Candidatus Omnitrophota bacterium]
MYKSYIPEEVITFINDTAGSLGCEVLEVSSRGAKGALIDVVLDKKGGISLDECTFINRTVTKWIAENGFFENGVTLDVCSPGLDRELKTDKDYFWARGKVVRVILREPVDSRNPVTGELVTVDNDSIVIREEGVTDILIRRGNITKARLYFVK